LVAAVVVAMALTTRNPVVVLTPHLAALQPYQRLESRPSLLLAALAVKTQVVVAVLTVRLAHRPHLERVARVDH
jgi:hypothetical protein